MGKSNKAITKCCPFCEMQIAVACKMCPGCKRVLISNNKKVAPTTPTPAPPPPPPPPQPVLSSRRTSRIKREKPQFYDASQFEKKKQIKRRRLEPAPVEIQRGRQNTSNALNKKKIKKKGRTLAKEEQIEEEEQSPINLTPQKIKQLSVVLRELNTKLFSTSWSAT